MPGNPKRQDLGSLELISRVLTQGFFVVAVFSSIAVLLLAMGWLRKPFPGFLVEQTLVVSGYTGSGWAGRDAGMDAPERVTRVNDIPVETAPDFHAVLDDQAIGGQVSVQTVLPDGTVHVYPELPLGMFPRRDVVRLFLLPYLTGLAYLAIGLWVYRAKGQTRPGRALAFFCVCTAMAASLLFDQATTHAFGALWTTAVALLGGALISLVMRFPVAWKPAERHGWLLALPYGVSGILAVAGVVSLNDVQHPWAYVPVWELLYRYAALGILVFVGLTLRRAFGESSLVQRQARIILLGGALAFGPMFAYFVAPLVGRPFNFEIELLLPELLIFPVAVAIAILRFRLLAMDLIVNRTLVYGTLTAILAGAFTAGTLLSRSVFVAVTGERSDVAVIIATLIVASAFTPLKARLQAFVDRQFKQIPSTTGELRQFGARLQAYVDLNDPEQVTRQLMEHACHGLHAESARLSLYREGRLQVLHSWGPWRGNVLAAVQLTCRGEPVGLLTLGPRQSNLPYTLSELADLQQVGSSVACVLRLASGSVPGRREP